MYNTLQFLAVGLGHGRAAVARARRDAAHPAGDLMQRRGADQAGHADRPRRRARRSTVPEAGDFALPALDRVGVYTTDPPIPQFEQMAVNLLDANESNLVPADARPPGGDRRGRRRRGAGKIAAGAVVVDRRVRALPLLLIEWWVYTRRVHL